MKARKERSTTLRRERNGNELFMITTVSGWFLPDLVLEESHEVISSVMKHWLDWFLVQFPW